MDAVPKAVLLIDATLVKSIIPPSGRLSIVFARRPRHTIESKCYETSFCATRQQSGLPLPELHNVDIGAIVDKQRARKGLSGIVFTRKEKSPVGDFGVIQRPALAVSSAASSNPSSSSFSLVGMPLSTSQPLSS